MIYILLASLALAILPTVHAEGCYKLILEDNFDRNESQVFAMTPAVLK